MRIKPLLISIVDYAGLFPPAQLSLSEAMKSYKQAQSSPHHWMVDRLVLPATRLHEFVQILNTSIKIDSEINSEINSDKHLCKQWLLSVILSRNWAVELEQLQQVSQAAFQLGQPLSQPIEIRALEVAPLPPAEIEQLCLHLPAKVTLPLYFEIPFDAALEPYLQVLKKTNTAAKLRTGGMTSNLFPDSAQLSQRILSFAQARIPFKATAGLHHPLRGNYRLTYQPDSPAATMHGFLNVALLAAFAYQQSMTPDEATALLEERSIAAFQFTDTEVIWRNRHLSSQEVEQSRQQFFHSFGSCSFQEPIDDLHTLNLL